MKNAMTLGLAFLIGTWQAVTTFDFTSAQESELQILRHYEGEWSSNFTIAPQSDEDESKSFTGVVEGKWVVGSQFMEQTGEYRLDETSSPNVIKTMMSFDKKKKRYQFDYFNSSGDIQRSFGKWNAEAKTMTSTMTGAEDGNVTTIVADFSTADVEQWTIETKNREGKTVLKISGKNTRRKTE